jgi:hypothetical protein
MSIFLIILVRGTLLFILHLSKLKNIYISMCDKKEQKNHIRVFLLLYLHPGPLVAKKKVKPPAGGGKG